MYLTSLIVSLLVGLSAANYEGYLEFQLNFNQTCAKVNATGRATPPDPLTIALENATCTTHTVQTVMESAADTSTDYKFTVTFANKTTGYTIDILSGLERAEDCQWYLFYRAPEDDDLSYQPNARISFFVVAPNSTVALSYEPEPTVPPQPSPSPTPTSPSPTDDDDSGAPSSYGIANFCLAMFCLVMGGFAF